MVNKLFYYYRFRYRAHPYFAVRISVVHNWQFKVLTLRIQPVESHTSASLSRMVKETMREFLPKDKKFILFNTTDGAANMVLLSKLLGHERCTCIAHSLHLLLTADSLDKEVLVTNLLKKCKDIVAQLHFKGHLIANEVRRQQNDKLFDQLAKVQEELLADEENPVIDVSEETETHQLELENAQSSASSEAKTRIDNSKKYTLKGSVPTRWNSTLSMIESILHLQTEMQEVLKRLGKPDMCLDEEDIDLLKELKGLLFPFKQLTLLFSESSPNLSLVPLVRTKIRKTCEINPTDSAVIKRIKKNILSSLDKRVAIGKLIKISAAFDPAIRDAVLTREEAAAILSESFQSLKQSHPNLFESGKSTNYDVKALKEEDKTEASSSAKQLRLDLIKETCLLLGNNVQNEQISSEIAGYINLTVTTCT